MPAEAWLSSYIRSTFQSSCRRHLLVTGRKGCGKTTLIESLIGSRPLPGVRSCVERGADGQPVLVALEERTGPGRCVIGRRRDRQMFAQVPALDRTGVQLLRRTLYAPGKWVCVDEIGFLEEASPLYQQAMWQLFEHKRVLAALRKEELPFLIRLRSRADCLLLDLDAAEGWQ